MDEFRTEVNTRPRWLPLAIGGALLLGLGTIGGFALSRLTGRPAPTATVTQAPSLTPTLRPTATSTPTNTSTPDSTPTVSIDAAGAECLANLPRTTVTVLEVVDGDTIRVHLDDGRIEPLRYIGMDAEEYSGGTLATDSTARNIQLVKGKSVMLFKDVSEADHFGRLLRYVVSDGVFVNRQLVADGLARAKSYPPDTACNDALSEAQATAQAAGGGMWAVAPTPEGIPTGTRFGGIGPCPCTGPDLDCGDFETGATAEACFDYCNDMGYGDIYRLDGDSDGDACEPPPF